MNKIAIIPARGGSKRIPRKNIKDFLGKPIIAYSIEAALKSQIFDIVMVSTDDDEIAEIAKSYGAKVPFMRSTELSSDTAGTAPVILEVLDIYAKKNVCFEYGCCIYPCAPLVTSEKLKESMNLLVAENCDTIVPIVKFSYPPQRGLVIRNEFTVMVEPKNYTVRSQDLEPIYHDAGQFYCFSVAALKEQKTLFCKNTRSLVLSELEVQDIDTNEDWEIAEMKFLFKKQNYIITKDVN